jgi:hypothetical protein
MVPAAFIFAIKTSILPAAVMILLPNVAVSRKLPHRYISPFAVVAILVAVAPDAPYSHAQSVGAWLWADVFRAKNNRSIRCFIKSGSVV